MILDPVGDRTLCSLLEDAAAGRSDAVFLRRPDGTVVTYGAFLALRDRLAGGLRERGIASGQVVALHLATSVPMLAVLCAVHRLGAVAAMSDPANTDRELAVLIRRSQACLVVTDGPAAGDVAAVTPAELEVDAAGGLGAGALGAGELGPDSPATILFTSGTTAEPKAVVYRHGHHVHGAEVYATLLRLDPGSLLLHHFPLFHMNGLNQLGAALGVGCEILLVDRFRSGAFDGLLDRFAPTATFLNGTHVKMIREAGTTLARPSPLQRVGMALQLADRDYDWFEATYGPVLTEGYGQTESITICLATPVRGARRGSCGLPVAGYEARVVGEGSSGELQVRSASRFGLMDGYLGDPEATRAAFDDGWLRTGDVARIEDGVVFFVDREKDIIKRAGENISAAEVEMVLGGHPAVSEVAVIGRPDGLREEVPVAVLVATAPVTADDLREYCSTRLARHKVPAAFVLTDALPRTAVGKVEKKALRTGRTPVTTWTLLERAARRCPERPALVLPDARLTYRELRDRAVELAGRLTAAGLDRGDRVLLAVHNGPDWVVWFTALGRLGAIVVPADPRSAPPELAHTLAHSGAVMALAGSSCTGADATFPAALRDGPLRLVVWDDEPSRPAYASTLPAPHAIDAVAPPEPDDPLLIQYTSGSTAAPKGAVLTHDAVTGVAAGVADRLDLADGDRLFSGSPFFHVGGPVLHLSVAATIGGTAVALPRFEAEAAMRIIAEQECVLFSGVEPHFLLVLDAPGFAPERLRSVRKATSTGSPAVLRRIATEMDIPGLVALYGLSETASNLTMCRVDEPETARWETCGHPHDGTAVRILDPAGEDDVSAGEVGEIVVRGFTVMREYWADPTATAAARTSDGWLRTGDLGAVDDAGRLRFSGRVKDMLRVGGENVAAAEVEAVLLGLRDVAQAAVLGAPHPQLGEVPVAFVTAAADLDASELQRRVADHVATRLSSFKCPRTVIVLDAMPLTGSGKIHKPTLRATL